MDTFYPRHEKQSSTRYASHPIRVFLKNNPTTGARPNDDQNLLLAIAAIAAVAGTARAEKVLKWGASRDIGSLRPYSFGDSFTFNVLNHL